MSPKTMPSAAKLVAASALLASGGLWLFDGSSWLPASAM